MLLDASKYYTADKWQYVLDVLRKALLLKGSLLSDVEQASIIWHDSAKKDKGTENHGRNGAVIARKLLKKWFSPEDVKRVAIAIKQHNLDLRVKNPVTLLQKIKYFASPLALLLAIADDSRPLDKLKTWNKILTYNIKGTPEDKTASQLYQHMKLYLDPRKRMPLLKYYKDAFEKDSKDFIKWLDSLTLQLVSDKINQFKEMAKQSAVGAIAKAVKNPAVAARFIKSQFFSPSAQMVEYLTKNSKKALFTPFRKGMTRSQLKNIRMDDRAFSQGMIDAINDIRKAADIDDLISISQLYSLKNTDFKNALLKLLPFKSSSGNAIKDHYGNFTPLFLQARDSFLDALLKLTADFDLVPILKSIYGGRGSSILGFTYRDPVSNTKHMYIDSSINPAYVDREGIISLLKAHLDRGIGRSKLLPYRAPGTVDLLSQYYPYPSSPLALENLKRNYANYLKSRDYNDLYLDFDDVFRFSNHKHPSFKDYPGGIIAAPFDSGHYNYLLARLKLTDYFKAINRSKVSLDNELDIKLGLQTHPLDLISQDIPYIKFPAHFNLPTQDLTKLEYGWF